MKFILPRLLGLTVLVGLATFILTMVFKLLLAGLVLAATATLIFKITGKNRQKKFAYNRKGKTFFPEQYFDGKAAFSKYNESLAIIPIQ